MEILEYSLFLASRRERKLRNDPVCDHKLSDHDSLFGTYMFDKPLESPEEY